MYLPKHSHLSYMDNYKSMSSRLMLKLNLQYFGHLKGRVDKLEKTMMLGKIEGRRRRE